ncbi:unnamed protein product [Spirodela intermedia]|uniref:Homeobox domain-containing protein n=1 Tax=Spirodela intermedia TaxID=51605 RepID=A0A7I8JKE5_SPIIN|nr:unnamed protein product [Spirodela intermedia]CAA6670530.1 unnamed protein product [Spirodela intermedia]
MEDAAAYAEQEHGLKKKSQIQIEFLEKLYSEDKYPNQKDIEDCAAVLNLTYNQVRMWFTKRRRKEKKENEKLATSRKSSSVSVTLASVAERWNTYAANRDKDAEEVRNHTPSKNYKVQKSMRIAMKHKTSVAGQWEKNFAVSMEGPLQEKSFLRLQVLFPKDYILKRIFRKDGPPLGVEFDCLPEKGFGYRAGPYSCPHSCRSSKRILERRKVFSLRNGHALTKRHGIGKGLMTVWRVTNPEIQSFPTGVDFGNEDLSCSRPNDISKERHCRKNMAGSSPQGRKVVSSRKRKAPCKKDGLKMPHTVECNLGILSSTHQEQSISPMNSIDDEELELSELQTRSNPPRCSAHLGSNGRVVAHCAKVHMLARFPPPSVRMKQPICGKPWDSSPEIVKKFFKVVCFLYTHAAVIDIFPLHWMNWLRHFTTRSTICRFQVIGKHPCGTTQASSSDVGKELTDGFFPRGSKDCRFLGFLHSVRQRELDVDFWSRSLNALTWVEILRQVMISAGYASRKHSTRRSRGEDGDAMVKYGLRPCTLKGELYSILSEQGSTGSKVNDLAKASQIVGLDLCATPAELEALICCTLSSDCTLFEKIGHSAYRLRRGTAAKKSTEDSESDTEYSGSVDDDDSADSSSSSGSEDEPSGLDCSGGAAAKRQPMAAAQSAEIDESFSGAGWLLGLMEGEYSDLTIEEKLDALAALVDITGSCSSLRMEEPAGGRSAAAPNLRYRDQGEDKEGARFKVNGWDPPVTGGPLGFDRRYNSYWLFLGPCGSGDPGHRRVYFESSEDGRWEVIDTDEALSALVAALDGRGARECLLLDSLRRREVCLARAMAEFASATATTCQHYHPPSDTDASSGHSSSPISDVDNNLVCEGGADRLPPGVVVPELGRRAEERRQQWARAQAFDRWLWGSFYGELGAARLGRRCFSESLARCEACHDLFWRDEKHCRICHVTFELDFDQEERFLIHTATCRPAVDGGAAGFPGHRVLPSQLQALKAAVHALEVCMPEDALVDAWRRSAHKLWVKRLRRVSSMPELFQVVADFVAAIRESWLQRCCSPSLPGGVALDDVAVLFQTMPQTTSAFALWLVKLDGLVAPISDSFIPRRRRPPPPSKECALLSLSLSIYIYI